MWVYQFIVCFLIVQSTSCKNLSTTFEEAYEWTFINFTWTSPEAYQEAINSNRYIPENNAMAGAIFDRKTRRNFIALPRFRQGTPVTLAYLGSNETKNPLLVPFPSWEMNVEEENCTTLQNVQSMVIDRKRHMWVIDGVRINNLTNCPPKIVVMDLEGNKILRSYDFPNDICLHSGGYLNDLVVDETDDGDFAYISDSSSDSGMIIYSYKSNKSWKIRDPTMLPDPRYATFHMANTTITSNSAINGIALSPKSSKKPEQFVYYCALAGLNLYRITTKVVKNETLCRSKHWQHNITFIGVKPGQSDGIVMDNVGKLYYTLPDLHAVGLWNTNRPFETAAIIAQNNVTMEWPDSFAFDEWGFIYLLTNHLYKYMNYSFNLEVSSTVEFRLLRRFVLDNSYIRS